MFPVSNPSRSPRFSFFGPLALAIALTALSPAYGRSEKSLPAPSEGFLKYWKSGLAELTTYRGLEERYGAMRAHSTVMVFVYEEIDDKTRIKIESDRIPPERAIPVLKLNRLLHFNTGIYDYNVMTSVFTGLEGPGVTRPFLPRKIALTVQEWCGMVFQEVLPRKDGIHLAWHSYFESEGEGKRVLPMPEGQAVYEDELPILLRELDGEWMMAGESKAISLFPAEWRTRKKHRPAAWTPATLEKKSGFEYKARNQAWPAMTFVLRQEDDTTTWIIEDKAPRKLLAWHVSTGAYGEFQTTTRKTYWIRNKPENEKLREGMELPLSPPIPARGTLSPRP